MGPSISSAKIIRHKVYLQDALHSNEQDNDIDNTTFFFYLKIQVSTRKAIKRSDIR